MDIICADIVGDHAGHGAGLRYLFRLETFTFQHIQKVGVAAKVNLIGAVDPYAAVNEQAGECAMPGWWLRPAI